MPLTADDWLTLDQVKKHLNMSVAVGPDDAELEDFIQRSENAVTERIGVVKQPAAPVVEYHAGGGRAIILKQRPVFDVTSVSVLGTPVAEADRDTGADGWFLGSERGAVLSHTAAFPAGFVKVTYTPGWPDIPAGIELAALELLRHLWKTQRGSGVRPGSPQSDAASNTAPGDANLLPPRVAESLAPYMAVGIA